MPFFYKPLRLFLIMESRPVCDMTTKNGRFEYIVNLMVVGTSNYDGVCGTIKFKKHPHFVYDQKSAILDVFLFKTLESLCRDASSKSHIL